MCNPEPVRNPYPVAVQADGERPVTLIDVARASGVHVSTASRVLTGSSQLKVTAGTRRRVLDAATALGYRPNASARALKLSSTGALGLLVPSLRNPVYAEIIHGAFTRAWSRGFVILLAEDRADSDAELAYEQLVANGRIDGLLIAGLRPGSTLVETEARSPAPYVYVNRRRPGGHNVSMREEDAAQLAVDHLLALGHSRLAHVAGPAEIDTARRRATAFDTAVLRAGAAGSIVHAAFDERSGFEAIGALLSGSTSPTGVFVSNNTQAIGVLAGARAAGVDVPGALSVVTYDDAPVSEFLSPPLTCIRMPLEEMGATAVDALLSRLAGASPTDVTVATAPVLVKRQSTAPPNPWVARAD
jgi:DNA-binding LacI/PurR family transcriptional regulator